MCLVCGYMYARGLFWFTEHYFKRKNGLFGMPLASSATNILVREDVVRHGIRPYSLDIGKGSGSLHLKRSSRWKFSNYLFHMSCRDVLRFRQVRSH